MAGLVSAISLALAQLCQSSIGIAGSKPGDDAEL
jgi:hypothetical protein